MNFPSFFKGKDPGRLGWMIAIEVVAILFVSSFFLPGGDDLYRYYLPFAGGCLDCGFVPYPAQWILHPLSLLPLRIAWPVWTLVSAAGFAALCRFTRVNPALVLLSFPALGQFWLGQIDLLVTAGLVLALLAEDPFLRGVGLVLAMVKPQVAALPVLVLLLNQRRRDVPRLLAAPAVVLLASLVVFGPLWPITWLTGTMRNLPMHVWRLASSDLWPYGLVFLSVPFLMPEPRSRFEAALAASAVATPFFSVYSYIILLVFRMEWWALPLSYAWALLFPWFGKEAMRFAWILPAALLLNLILKNKRTAGEPVPAAEGSA